MIEAVTLDFWNTLYREDDSARTRRRDRRAALAQSFFGAAGRQIEAARVHQAVTAVAETLGDLQWRRQANWSHIEIGQAIGRELGFDLTDAESKVLAELISSAGTAHPPIPLDFTGQLLAALAGKVKLALISDTGLTFGMHLRQVMASHGLEKYFDHFTFSDETQSTKPMERQFLYTLGALGVRPERAVHVGDLERRDVDGARSAGMKTVRILTEGSGRDSSANATVQSLAEVAGALRRLGAPI